ncbi:MAG TPA: BON domain-containing protein [Oscillatoriales cyanobacterium M59_W2019_021]|nr:MAG: BON domain-containing protein [Cyanobacteria bacterium J055]HIK30726.1 BON domain-containing protein [Oscillatoriales cyanobacterium M4454_W2019_049]HIK51911.1 BON domain-containing protein [Oscillatoriales cyanobacterium M59_W2019_021]
MVVIGNRTVKPSENPSAAVEVLPGDAQELNFFFDCLARVLGSEKNENGEISASRVVENGASPGEVGEAEEFEFSELPTPQPNLLALLEPDRTDADTTRAMEGLLEFLTGNSSAKEDELTRLRELNTQLSQRLLLLEEQSNAEHFRQLNLQLGERVAHLEAQLSASHQQIDRLLSQVSELLTRQAAETQAKEKYKRRLIALGLSVGCFVAGWGLWTLIRRPGDAQIAAEVERTIAAIDRIDGMDLSATFDRGHVSLGGTARQAADFEAISATLSQIPGVKTVTNTIKTAAPAIATRLYFEVNSPTVVPRDLEGKLRQIKQVMQQYPQLHLKIIGHSHPEERGGEGNLALERAQTVQTMLEDIGIDRRRTIAVSRPGSPPDVAPNQPTWLSQCVLFETEMPGDDDRE